MTENNTAGVAGGMTFDGSVSEIRTEIKEVGNKLNVLKKATAQISSSPLNFGKADTGEIMANMTIAYRHLEDAAMRLGKVLQAWDGGSGIYDTNDAKRVASGGPGTI